MLFWVTSRVSAGVAGGRDDAFRGGGGAEAGSLPAAHKGPHPGSLRGGAARGDHPARGEDKKRLKHPKNHHPRLAPAPRSGGGAGAAVPGGGADPRNCAGSFPGQKRLNLGSPHPEQRRQAGGSPLSTSWLCCPFSPRPAPTGRELLRWRGAPPGTGLDAVCPPAPAETAGSSLVSLITAKAKGNVTARHRRLSPPPRPAEGLQPPRAEPGPPPWLPQPPWVRATSWSPPPGGTRSGGTEMVPTAAVAPRDGGKVPPVLEPASPRVNGWTDRQTDTHLQHKRR